MIFFTCYVSGLKVIIWANFCAIALFVGLHQVYFEQGRAQQLIERKPTSVNKQSGRLRGDFFVGWRSSPPSEGHHKDVRRQKCENVIVDSMLRRLESDR